MSRPTFVFWLFLGILVNIRTLVLTVVVLNIGSILCVLVFVLPDGSGVDTVSRSILILALALTIESSPMKTTVLVILSWLC